MHGMAVNAWPLKHKTQLIPVFWFSKSEIRSKVSETVNSNISEDLMAV